MSNPGGFKQTLCWDCRRSVKKSCSWSRRFRPVQGWDADEVYIKGTPGVSYCVNDCPKFVRDSLNYGMKRLGGKNG